MENLKEKVKNWLKQQSKQSKVVLLIVFILHFCFAVYQTPFYLLSQYGLGIFLGRLLGQLLGVMIPLLLISTIIALMPYLIFKKVAEKYKKYLDYFAITFLIVSILLLYFGNFYKPF